MRLAVWFIYTLTCAVSATAAEFGHSLKDRQQINGSLNEFADLCVRDYGFTRVARKPDAPLVDKIEAYLLLSSDADGEVRRWADIMHEAHALERAEEDNALADRLADFTIAAGRDPESYDRAESLWVQTFKRPVESVVSACKRAAADPFLGANYVSGTGSADRYDQELKQMFADSVRGVTARPSSK